MKGALAGAVGLLLLAGCSHSAAVKLPARSADPATVLKVYLTALKAGDCPSAHALTTKTFRPGNGDLCGAVHVTAYALAPQGPATPNDHEVVYATTLSIKGGDETLPDGTHTWFYTLDKQSDGSWRLAGGGSGP